MSPPAKQGLVESGGGTAFVGRGRDLEALGAALRSARLVTIVGGPGVGKTRLATHFASRSLDLLPAGDVRLCELAEATDGLAVATTVARALGLVLHDRNRSIPEQVSDALRARGSTLLVLDNFEHVAEHATETVGRWLRETSDVRFLVTSRHRLRLQEEVVFDLEPLPIPAPGEDPAGVDAVELFLDRARRVRRDLAVDGSELAAIAALVRRLDGLPLAIELTASRMRVMTARELLAILPDRLDALGRGPTDVAPRQETIVSAIDWSWSLLSPAEQAALAQCSIFRGPFTVTAAEQVLDLGTSAAPVLEVLQALNDKSLVTGRAPVSSGDELRCSLYWCIREYAWERLVERSEVATLRARHATYYARAGAAWARAAGPDLGRLTPELDNLLAAHAFALEQPGDPERARLALEAAIGAAPVFVAKGPLARGMSLLDRAIGAAADAGLAPLVAEALVRRAEMRGTAGRMAESLADYDRAEQLAAAGADEVLPIDIALGQAVHWFVQGESGKAERCYAQALAAAQQSGNPTRAARALMGLGFVLHRAGRADAARACHERAVATFRAAGDRQREAFGLYQVGAAALDAGDLDGAEEFARMALALGRETDNRLVEGRGAFRLAQVEHARGDLTAAAAGYRASLAVLDEVGDRRTRSLALRCLGVCLQELGQLDQARAHYEEALASDHEIGEIGEEAYALGSLATLAASRGDRKEARRLFRDARARARDIRERALELTLRVHGMHLAAALEGRPMSAPDSTSLGSFDARIAARCLTRAHDLSRRAARPDPARRRLTVGPSARWFELDGNQRVDLSRLGPPRKLLAALADRHDSAPDATHSLDELFHAGWGAQSIHPEAAARRVYTALWTLRKLGLQDILVRRDDGYLLDPDLDLLRG